MIFQHCAERWNIISVNQRACNIFYMEYSDNLFCENKDGVREKIERIRNEGKEKLHLVLDFDRTLTPSRNEKGNETATWKLLNKRLPLEKKAVATALYEKYRPLEIAGKMTAKDAADWWSSCLNLYRGSGLRWSDLAYEVESTIPIRPGVKELFETCAEKGIPTVIISAGIRDVIELWCQKFEIKPTIILSTNLYFNNEGYVCGWDKDSLIHVLNKHDTGHKELSKIRKDHPNTILIGDSIDDAAMAAGDKNVLRCIIDDPRNDDMREPGFEEKIFEKFDLLSRQKSLLPLTEIIKSIE